MANTFRLLTLKASEITPYLPAIAKLELEVFREYPYLYEETLDNQIKFLTRYAECDASIMVLVLDNENVVGVSTGMPLYLDTEPYKKPFLDHGIDVKTVFYLGESLLLPAYRGKKIYRDFFAMREMAAIENGCTISAFIAVERPLNDVKRPENYAPLDPVWRHFGYEKHPELYVETEWAEIGDKKPSTKKLVYWLKNL